MSTKLASLGAAAPATGVYELYKELRDCLEPSEESMKKVKEYEKIIGGITHSNYKEQYICEAFNDIKEEEFSAFVDEVAERFEMNVETKQSILDIPKSGVRGNYSGFENENGKVKMFYYNIIVEKKDGMTKIAFAAYNIIFEHSAKREVRYFLGLIPITKPVAGSGLPITEGEKEMIKTRCLVNLFDRAVKKCKNSAPSSQPLPQNH